MRRLAVKVTGYIFLRYLIYLIVIYAMNRDAKFVKWSDLQNGEDWFYFLWLFLIIPIIESILFVLPFTYGLNKITEHKNFQMYLLMALLFAIEGLIFYLLTSQKVDIGLFSKVGISLVLFLVLFWKRLFLR